MNDFGTLIEYDTDLAIDEATEQQQLGSVEASQIDSGVGVIRVDGVSCYVQD